MRQRSSLAMIFALVVIAFYPAPAQVVMAADDAKKEEAQPVEEPPATEQAQPVDEPPAKVETPPEKEPPTTAPPVKPTPATAPPATAPAATAQPTTAPPAKAMPPPAPPAKAPAVTAAPVTAPPTPATTVPAPTAAATAAPAPAPAPILPDASLKTTIELVRKSPIGSEPNSIAYLDLMGAGRATAAQVNDFAAYIAKRGMPRVALSFQEYALELDPQNATLWQNLGTIQRTTGALGPAATAFKKAIAIDPINALAHYNLGAVYDAQGSYDDAIEEYRRALVLDPALADPRKNPQVVNNEHLLAVKLEIYRDQAGSLGLPLLQLQKPSPPQKTAAAKKP